jgi:hypothetical protein
MYDCPHCGQPTFVGSGTCNACARDFAIARLEDLYLRYEGVEQLGMRAVYIDPGSASVIFLLREAGKKGKPSTNKISILDFRRHDEGWKHWTGQSMDAALARDIAAAVVEVTS